MTEPDARQAELTDDDPEQTAVWAAELDRRNEGDGHGNPNRHHDDPQE